MRTVLAATYLLQAGCQGSEPERFCEEPGLLVAQELSAADLVGAPTDPAWSDDPSWGGPGIALGDLDGDGWLDAVLAAPTGASRILRNDGTGTLVPDPDVTLPAAVGVALADFDGDGILDAWLGTDAGEPDLILTQGFTQTTALVASDGYSVTGSVADYDLDGDIDLFVARHVGQPDNELIAGGGGVGDGSVLYTNEGGVLTDASARFPTEFLDGLSFQGAWLDADADDDLDMYLVNDYGALVDPNALFINEAGGLTHDPSCGCELEMSGMGAAVADFDGNATPDMFITDTGNPALLLGDNTGAWYDAALARHVEIPFTPEHQAAWGSAPLDLDLDGRVDIAAVFGPLELWHVIQVGDADGTVLSDSRVQRDVFLRNRGGLYFSEDGRRVGFDDTRVGRSVVVGDLNRDFRPDLVTAGWALTSDTTGDVFVRVSLAEGGCGTGITVRGGVEDVGARVETVVAGETRVGWILPSTTFSQSATELYLGLSGYHVAERITVHRPGGAEETFDSVEAGTVIEL